MLCSLVRVLLFYLLVLSPVFVFADNILYTEIEKLADNSWQVSYQSAKPIKAVMFSISPDNSRIQRWQPTSADFALNYVNGREIATRKDGRTFTKVSFQLTPSYIHLPKNYAPFSPFSNGAMLLHSGRFFACSNICSGNENLWALAAKAPIGDTIIADGIAYNGKTSWWDKNDGQKIYIGQQQFIDNGSYIGIIDPKLHASVGQQLTEMLPKMMALLETSYGRLVDKPMLFASFGKTDDGSFGHQGGTLPKQVFMHWYGNHIYNKQDVSATLWFFAHEAAHMYQALQGKAMAAVDNWLHEGHAEMMAKKIMLNLVPENRDFIDAKINKARAECQKIIASSTLSEQVEQGNYRSLYQCGLYIFNTIEEHDTERTNTTEALWLNYIKHSKQIGKVETSMLLELAETSYGLSTTYSQRFQTLVGHH